MSRHRPRAGSLQFWPRKRMTRVIPNVNWDTISKNKKAKKGLNGFIGYKVGMTSAYVKDSTDDSMTKGKKIIVPATIIECPKVKIYSVRLYKDGVVLKDIIVGYDKELKSKLKQPKEIHKHLDHIKEDFDDVRVIVYSEVKTTGIKKTPEIIEMGLGGTKEEKLAFIKEKIGKEISVSDVFGKELVDVRGLTKGKGLQGPVKRFGISLKSHKSEKGRRRPGSLGPWHPARVTFRVAQAGQVGMYTRVTYNSMVLDVSSISQKNINKPSGFDHYGNVKTDYVLVKGSIMGPTKRGILLTRAFRPSKLTVKQKLEVIELR